MIRAPLVCTPAPLYGASTYVLNQSLTRGVASDQLNSKCCLN